MATTGDVRVCHCTLPYEQCCGRAFRMIDTASWWMYTPAQPFVTKNTDSLRTRRYVRGSKVRDRR